MNAQSYRKARKVDRNEANREAILILPVEGIRLQASPFRAQILALAALFNDEIGDDHDFLHRLHFLRRQQQADRIRGKHGRMPFQPARTEG